MGLEKFAAARRTAGADGVLVTDLTPEESEDYREILHSHHLGHRFSRCADLQRRTSAENCCRLVRVPVLISRTGVTGAKDSLPDELPALLRRARAVSHRLPIAVGFGISLPGHVSVLGGLADAAVVGSALVSEIENACSTDAACACALRERIMD